MNKLIGLNDFYHNLHDEINNGTDDIWTIINNALSKTNVIDADEIIHAYWKDGQKCSNCGTYIATDCILDNLNESENRYCYNCGAKMGDKNEN